MLLRGSGHPGFTKSRPVGRGNLLWITYILFWPYKDMEGLPRWVISSMPGPPPRQHEHERRYKSVTHIFILTRRIWKDDYDGKMIFGDIVDLKLPDICLTGEEKLRNPHSGNLSRLGIEPGPAAWQARMLPEVKHFIKIFRSFRACIKTFWPK